MQRLGVVAAERAELEPGERARAVRALERGQQLLRHLPRTHRQREQHRRRRRAPQQRAEQLERPRVGPVQVVEHQHERLPGRQDHEQVADRLVRAVALVGEDRRALWVRTRSSSSPERLQHGGRQPAHVLVERVDEDPERQVALELGRAARQHQAAAVVGHRLELGQQPRLADAGLAHELDRARLALERALEHAQLLARVRRVAPRGGPHLRRYVNSIPFAIAWKITFSGSAATARTNASNSVPGEKTT